MHEWIPHEREALVEHGDRLLGTPGLVKRPAGTEEAPRPLGRVGSQTRGPLQQTSPVLDRSAARGCPGLVERAGDLLARTEGRLGEVPGAATRVAETDRPGQRRVRGAAVAAGGPK
jgi:hypothetical protein